MNIQEAKEEITHTLRAYLHKDAMGSYTFPLVRQRPILLIGPPGIGKTAVMEQIARECQVGLVSYTMTHHTRQSAIGLPKLVEKNYGGMKLTVTEYTMSEIVASVYDCMERTGKKEGILFIDEINCVSETLAPTMLQLLQNKQFGSHRIPDGWILVAAGNPAAYNKSVREFDIATLDRIRLLNVEADLDAWLRYGTAHQIHGAILSYLQIHKEHFYLAESKEGQKSFVTARGWEDLSCLLKSYEEEGLPCSGVMGQYLQKEAVAEAFARYYELYEKYGMDYDVTGILNGSVIRGNTLYEEKRRMAVQAPFDERMMVIQQLLSALDDSCSEFVKTDQDCVQLHAWLSVFLKGKGAFSEFVNGEHEKLRVKEQMELLTAKEAETLHRALRILDEYEQGMKSERISAVDAQNAWLRVHFQELVSTRQQCVEVLHHALSRAFSFTEDCFGREQEMILLVTGLTRNDRAMEFIRLCGCTEYLEFAGVLLPEDTDELQRQAEALLRSEQKERP